MAQTKVQLVSNIVGNVSGGASFTGIVTAAGGFSGNASSATYATSAGVSTYATTSGVSTSVIGGIASVTQLNVSGGITTVGFITATNSYTSGISSVGTAITMYGSSGIISATKYYGDGSSLSGIDATRIVSGLSSVAIVSASSTISAFFNGSNVFNVVGTGVTMVAGQRLDVSAYSETVQTLGSSGSPISGSNALNIDTYSTFIAYVGTSSVTFTLTGAVTGRLSSWTLILIYTNSGSRTVSFSFGTLRYAGGSSSVTLSNTGVHDVLSFFTADGATNTYASVVGLGFAT